MPDTPVPDTLVPSRSPIGRRRFLSLTAIGLPVAAAAACTGQPTNTPTPTHSAGSPTDSLTTQPTAGGTMELTPPAAATKAPSKTFTGDVYVVRVKQATEPSRLISSKVTFTPGARSHWHSHAVGQTLHITEGVALIVNRDGQVLRARPGDTVWTPPGEEHWHGSTTDGLMCHLAMLEGTADGDGTTWLEAVTDEQYEQANNAR